MKKISAGLAGGAVTAVQAVSQFLTLSILANFYSLSEVGQFSYVNAILVVIFMFFSFGLRNAYVLEYSEYGYRSFLVVRLVSLVFGSVLAYIAVSFSSNYSVVFLPLLIYRLAELLFEVQWANYQINNRYTRVLITQGGRYLVSTISLYLSSMYMGFVDSLYVYALSGLLFLGVACGPDLIKCWINDRRKLNAVEVVRRFWVLSFELLID